MNWFSKLKEGLGKSSSAIKENLNHIFLKKKLDETTLDELEDLLIQSDMGVKFAAKFRENLRKSKFDKEVSEEEIKNFLANLIEESLNPVVSDFHNSKELQVLLFCGVNGNGKTTTIGKLAAKFQQEGKKVMIAACDTFRAAAVEQIEIWAKRANAFLIKGEPNSDPASVAFRALTAAKAEKFDILMIDTAGRLQNQANLMAELSKIIKVLKKIDESAPHEAIMVLDGTTGQNAISQMESFDKFVNLTGLIVTKLDGTAKAGIIVALAEKFSKRILAIGVGEKIEDLKPFSSKDFAKNLIT